MPTAGRRPDWCIDQTATCTLHIQNKPIQLQKKIASNKIWHVDNIVHALIFSSAAMV